MKRNLPRGYQRNIVSLVLTNDELDWFESLFTRDSSQTSIYIKQQITEIRRQTK